MTSSGVAGSPSDFMHMERTWKVISIRFLATIKAVHETLHAEGTPRLSTAIKIGTRTDKDASLDDKLFDTDA